MIDACRICGGPVRAFLDLGMQPLPNRFLTQEQLHAEEPKWPLQLLFCEDCTLVQLGTTVPPESIFSDYAFASSVAWPFRLHFEQLADRLMAKGIQPGAKVVDIGSNDGILLRPLKARGIFGIGVDPAKNLCEIAWRDGLSCWNEFFTKETVEKIIEGTCPLPGALGTVNAGPADAVVACNVFGHIPDANGFLENVKVLMAPDGMFVAEFQYVGEMLRTMQFDNVYLEHVFYWSLASARRFLGQHRLRIFDVELIPTHGGSIRIWADRAYRPQAPILDILLNDPLERSMRTVERFDRFAAQVERFRGTLREYLAEYGREHLLIGYGAPAKSTTLLNYCGIDANTLAYIVDDSPTKQGKFTPGTHIPIRAPDILESLGVKPAYILILAWNFTESIMARWGHLGKPWILPIPPTVVDPRRVR